ncbi:uncharacterized protein LOC131650116 [Vicia villosa]|uniref:uncharacterized protein LOC131650116 n=1 Tax=Vicia villosa TaxID=3911 RepID=UPI00273BB9CA|nr:uncharacterized protein LOC131650116 [Vicia villosa]
MGSILKQREGWTKVGRRFNRRFVEEKWDVAGGGRKVAGAVVTFFFFTKFWIEWKARDLLFELQELGEIDEVVIPPKWDKRGRRCGFVRFFNVEDEKLLAIKLDSLVLEGRKLFANLPRFHKQVKDPVQLSWKKDEVGKEVSNVVKGGKFQGKSSKAWVDKRSFADVLHNRKANPSIGDDVLEVKTVFFSSEKEEYNRYSKACTRVMKDPGVAMNLKQIFHEEGLFSIRLTVLGPNLYILEDLVLGKVEVFIDERRVWWEQWFSSIRPWAPNDMDSVRLLWLRISGTPCHAWGENFFKVLAESRGTFVKNDELTVARSSMEEARICIKSGWKEVINVTVKAVIDGVSFFVSMREDPSLLKEMVPVRRNLEEDESDRMIPRRELTHMRRIQARKGVISR